MCENGLAEASKQDTSRWHISIVTLSNIACKIALPPGTSRLDSRRGESCCSAPWYEALASNKLSTCDIWVTIPATTIDQQSEDASAGWLLGRVLLRLKGISSASLDCRRPLPPQNIQQQPTEFAWDVGPEIDGATGKLGDSVGKSIVGG